MDCRTFQNSISAAVDGYLPEAERARFHAHGELCPRCLRAYEFELATKKLIQDHLEMVKTPGSVAAAIIDHLHVDGRGALATTSRGRRRFWASPGAYAGGALALATVVLIVLLAKGPLQAPSPSVDSASLIDILADSRASYKAIIAGQLQPQIVSHQMREVESFFTGKMNFPLVLPVIPNVQTIDGMLNEHHGTKRAHVVYRHPKAPIYVYETCWKTVQSGTTLNLAPRVIEALQSSGRYLEDGPDGTTNVIWTHGGTVCIAVSNMPRQELLSTLGHDTSSPLHSAW